MRLRLTLIVFTSIVVLSGCPNPFGSPSKIDQGSVCRFDSEETAKQCKEGQLSFFQPNIFGNEQVPLIAAASYCDFEHPIIHTIGGVVCVFTGQRMDKRSIK